MKTPKIFVVVCLIGSFAFTTARSQAIVQMGNEWFFSDGYQTYITTHTHEVYTPNGYGSIILHFQLDPDDPIVPDKGMIKVNIYGWEIWINGDGVALVKYQYNGSDKKP